MSASRLTQSLSGWIFSCIYFKCDRETDFPFPVTIKHSVKKTQGAYQEADLEGA